jgi:hypothetical protein
VTGVSMPTAIFCAASAPDSVKRGTSSVKR